MMSGSSGWFGDYVPTQTILVTQGPKVGYISASPNPVDFGQNVTFTCWPYAGAPPYSIDWTFGDGSFATGQTASHTYLVPGSYDATCTLVDSKKGTASDALVVAVSSSYPTVTKPTSSTTLADVGQAVSFTTAARGGSGGNHFTWWGLPTGCRSPDAANVTCSPTGAGHFTVSVAVTDSSGVTARSASLALVVSPDPAITSFAASPARLLLGQHLVLIVKTSGGSGVFVYGYRGLPPGCSSENLSTFACTPSTAGTFVVEATVTDANGFQAAQNTTLTVSPEMLGFPVVEAYTLIAGGVAVVAVAVALFMVRRRKRRQPTAMDVPSRPF